MELRRFTEAAQAFAQLAALAPSFRHVQGNLLLARLHCCDWTDFDAGPAIWRMRCAWRACRDPVCVLEPVRLRPACNCAAPGCMRTRSSRLPRRARIAPYAHDKLRIAYLSGDFGEHAVSYLLAGVFERHDRKRFDTVAVSWGRQGEGPARRRVEASFSRFIDITAMSDQRAADLLRELEIDIAVDLGGHTLGQRTGILARRAAPLQVNYLGLPATMGAPTWII